MNSKDAYDYIINNTEYDKQIVFKIMNEGDLETRGVLYSSLLRSPFNKRLCSIISMKIMSDFSLKYLFDCIHLNPDGDWSRSRYIAAHEFCNLLKYYNEMGECDIENKYISQLEYEYRNGNDEIREVIVNGILEHLFESKKIIQRFSKWKYDPLLSVAYNLSMNWINRK